MTYQSLIEVWHHVLDFIVANQKAFGAPQIYVYSDEVEVRYRTTGVLKELPDGSESWRIFVDDGYLVLCCSWEYKHEDARSV